MGDKAEYKACYPSRNPWPRGRRNFYGIRASGDNKTLLVSQKLVSPRWENAEKLRFSEKP